MDPVLLALIKALAGDGGSSMAGKGAMYVHITEENGEYVSDKTYSEIYSAYGSGRVIVVIDDVSGKGQAIAALNSSGAFVADGYIRPTAGTDEEISWFSVQITNDSVNYNE